jgi:hypothetical protein
MISAVKMMYKMQRIFHDDEIFPYESDDAGSLIRPNITASRRNGKKLIKRRKTKFWIKVFIKRSEGDNKRNVKREKGASAD